MLIPTGMAGVVGRGGLVLKKHAPMILTVVGLASMTAGAVVAVKQTLKLEEVVEDVEHRVRIAKEHPEDAGALRKAYLRSALEFTKLYGPAVSMFASGIVSVAVGHGLLQRRNVQLVAAVNAVEKSFQAYRERVIKDLGEEKDRDYMLGIDETTAKGEDGRKSTLTDVDVSKMNQFSRIFDETNDYWQNEDPSFNQFFLTTEQRIINDILLHRGHVFLNEVYDRLGFKRIPEGNVLGWIVSKDGPNYIDFGLYDASTESKRNFINGYEKSIWLNFNIQGEVLSKIGK
jgi:hypothetical protein